MSGPRVAGALPYVLCILILSRLHNPYWLFGSAAAGSVLALTVYLLTAPAEAADPAHVGNLVLTTGVLWVAAGLLHVRPNPATDTQSRLALLVEGALHAKLLTDADGRILATNAEAERVFGYPRRDLIGSSIERLLPEAARSDHLRMRKQYLRNPSPRPMGAGRDLFGIRKDGSQVPIEIGLNPLWENGVPVVLATITDITERKYMEAENELLLRELSHRVKNSLSLASSIATLTARTAPSQEEFLARYTARLQALARGQTETVARQRQKADLERLVRREIAIMGIDDRVAINGPAVTVPSRQAGPLALAIHELATNAFKHGALSRDSGRVDIRWDLESDDGAGRIRLTWREQDGPSVVTPDWRGFGSELIEKGIPHSDVTCAYDHAGFVCTISLCTRDAVD